MLKLDNKKLYKEEPFELHLSFFDYYLIIWTAWTVLTIKLKKY